MPLPSAPPVWDSPPAAILFPKLRIYFAEFLNEGCPAHLRILSVPTCVGFGTGALFLTRSFSRQHSSLKFDSSVDSSIYHFSAFLCSGFACRTAYRLRRALPIARSSCFLCHSIAQTKQNGTGILACCPSPTLFASA